MVLVLKSVNLPECYNACRTSHDNYSEKHIFDGECHIVCNINVGYRNNILCDIQCDEIFMCLVTEKFYEILYGLYDKTYAITRTFIL